MIKSNINFNSLKFLGIYQKWQINEKCSVNIAENIKKDYN